MQVDPGFGRPGSSTGWEAGGDIHRGEDPCALPKACKNPVEIDGTKRRIAATARR